MRHTNRILDSASAKLERTHRTDFKLVKASEIGEGLARCVATVGGTEPTHEDLQRWVVDASERKLSVARSGIVFHEGTPSNMVSFVTKQNLLRRTVAECDSDPGLQRISASSYFDQDLGIHWQKEDEDSKYLVRCQPDGIASVIASISGYMGPKTQKRAVQILAKTVYVGDVVDFLLPDGNQSCGTVTAVDGGLATVKEKNTGNIYDRPFASIIDVLNNSATRKAGQQYEQGLWDDIYGPEFGSKLTNI